MQVSRLLILCLVLVVLLPTTPSHAAESRDEALQKDWRVSVGAGLIVAPAFTGSRDYSLLAVPDFRVAYKDLFIVNIRDGINYAVINKDGWRIGPVAVYTFPRSEKNGGSVFRIAGGDKNALVGMGDVPGTFSLGAFVEYSLMPYKFRLHLYKGVTGHEGVVAEGKVTYGGRFKLVGTPLTYTFGPHIRFGDQAYTNAYWGINPEQSERSGLQQYHADAGIISYGVSGLAQMSLTKSVYVSMIAGFERLGTPAAHSPLIRIRGSENQAMGGLSVSYGF